MPTTDPIAAVCDPDPWAYYDGLASRGPFRHEASGSWVVAAAADVAAFLDDPRAAVRPPGEPVPVHLAGTAAGDLFARLVRMRDDEGRGRVRDAIAEAFRALARDDLDEVCRSVIDELQHGLPPIVDGAAVDRWMRQVPVSVVARLCGLGAIELDALVSAAGALARCFGPGAEPDVASGASSAARVLQRAAARSTSGIAAALFGALDPDDAVANTAGLFFQTFDATAGLIGTSIGHLAHAASNRTVTDVVAHVLAVEPPVHSTRRFMTADVQVAGLPLRRGDSVLLVLAAAARDPSHRADTPRAGLAFGGGRHACPAHAVVPVIATHAVRGLIDVAGGACTAQRDGLSPVAQRAHAPLRAVSAFGSAASAPDRADALRRLLVHEAEHVAGDPSHLDLLGALGDAVATVVAVDVLERLVP